MKKYKPRATPYLLEDEVLKSQERTENAISSAKKTVKALKNTIGETKKLVEQSRRIVGDYKKR